MAYDEFNSPSTWTSQQEELGYVDYILHILFLIATKIAKGGMMYT